MRKEVEITLTPEQATREEEILQTAMQKARWSEGKVKDWRLMRRSIDARGRKVRIRLRVALFDAEEEVKEKILIRELQQAGNGDKVLIIGAGPAGYFAALELLRHGLKPVILERGKDVRERRRDLRAIQQFGEVNPHSNYCFGEGGAGTYSDGKLYTRSGKRGSVRNILQWLREHGAHEDIMVDAHPHIGSNKLPGVVSNVRQTILDNGGEIHFGHFVEDFIVDNDRVSGVRVNGQGTFEAAAVILATGHSARDIYMKLAERGVRLEQKDFALGVRIEHPQSLIDKIQYGNKDRGPYLPASSYRLACQVDDRGVYSFCMCPGGLIVPAATAPGEIVVNGMSLSRRDSAYANAGTVVSVTAKDIPSYSKHGELMGLFFQRDIEQQMFGAGDGSQKAPAQRLIDFAKGRISHDLPDTSYIPGIHPAPLHELLPDFIYGRLKEAVKQFDRKMHGYYTNDAIAVGTESRTSSPVRIPRDPATLMHPEVSGLFPTGEGAGFAGGIVSAAIDGQNVARQVALFYKKE